jgi:tetratricopeptide (TPR) repeat protein
MSNWTKAALAAALMTGAAGLTAAPAAAQKKKDEAGAQPKLKLSPDIVKSAQTAQTAIAAKDTAAAEPAVAQIEAGAKTDDDRYIAAALRLNVEALKIQAAQAAGQPIDATRLKAPLDVLIASPRTPKDALPNYTYQRGAIAFDAKNYAEAATYFGRAKALGYSKPDLQLQIAKSKIDSGDVNGGLADLDGAIQQSSATGKAPEDWYKYGISKSLQIKNNALALAWMKKWVAAYPNPKTWRDVIYTYGFVNGSLAKPDKAQMVDLFRLMRQTKSLADQNDYEEYGQKALDLGLPGETKAVITEGRAAGKLQATGASAELLSSANKMVAADLPLPSLEAKAKASPNGLLSAQTGDAYLSRGEYAKAIALYEQALQKGGVKADDVNTHLGIARAMSGDKAGAKTAFAAVTGQPRADIAGFWTLWLDTPTTA